MLTNRITKSAIIFLAVLAALSFGGVGQARAQGNLFPIATTAGQEAAISAAFDGSNYLVGIEGNAALGSNITAQLVSPTGTLAGSRISLGRTGGMPSGVAFDGTNYLMVWFDDATSGGELYGAFISKAGAVVGAPFRIDAGPLTQRRNTGGLAFGDGKYLAIYYKTDPSGKDIVYGRLISPDRTVGAEIRLSTGFGNQGDFQNVAFDGTRFFVVWNNHATNNEVKGRFITPTGELSSEIAVKPSGLPNHNPLTVAFDGSNYLVVWTEEIGVNHWDVFGQLVTPAGALVGGVIPISTAPGQQIAPVIAFDGTNYLVSWTDMRNDVNGNWSCDADTEGTCTDIRGQFVSKSGVVVGSEFIINNSLGDQFGGFSGQAVNGKLFGLINTGVNFAAGTFGDVLGTFITQTISFSPIVGAWGAAALQYERTPNVWYTESSRIVFYDNGTGTITGMKNDGINEPGQRIKPINETFTYALTSNPDGSNALSLDFGGGNVMSKRVVLSDNGNMAVMDGTGDPGWVKLTTMVKIDTTRIYANSDVTGEYYSLGYEWNVDNIVDPPNGNGKNMAFSGIETFNATNGTFNYIGKGNSVKINGDNHIWDDTGWTSPEPYNVNADGTFTVHGGAYRGYVTGDGRFFTGAGSFASNNWAGYSFMKKGDRTYYTADLAGKWAVVSFGDDKKTGQTQSFNASIGTITCDSAGQCSFKFRDRRSDGSTNISTGNVTLAVAADGSFGGSLPGGVPYAGAIGNNGNTIMFNVSFNEAEKWHREIFIGVRASNIGDLAGGPTVTVSGRVRDWSGAVIPTTGVTVTLVGDSTKTTTSSTTDGSFSLPGVPANTPVSLKFSRTDYLDVYSVDFTVSADVNINNDTFGGVSWFNMPTSGNLTAFGALPDSGKAIITGRVRDNTYRYSSTVGGVVVTAQGQSKSYAVKYRDPFGVLVDTPSTWGNGLYYVLNVDAGDTVVVSAAKGGWTFNARTFKTQANAVSMGSLWGTTAYNASFSGSVRTFDGTAIPGATIALSGNPGKSATSGEGGAFTFGGLPQDANFYARVTASGYVPTFAGPLNFGSTPVTGVTLTLFTQDQMTNFGVASSNGLIGGLVTDQTLNPLSGATVALTSRNGATYTVFYDGGGNTTIATGKFLVPNIQAGDVVKIDVTKAGYTFVSYYLGGFADAATTRYIVGTAIVGPTITYEGYVTDATANNAALGGVTVEQAGTPANWATSNDAGYYKVINLPSGSPFHLKMTKTGYETTYTAIMSSTSNLVTVLSQAFSLFTSGQLNTWGVTPGKGIIRTRVADAGGTAIEGATVTYTSVQNRIYTVCYDDACSLTATSAAQNGRYIIKNVEPGDVVTATAQKSGWTFNTRTYNIYANGISQGRITGTPPPSTGFREDFSTTVLDSSWQVVPGRGRYSLTDNPGHLSYYLEGPQAYSGSSLGVVSNWTPSLTLIRPFNGDNWVLRTKANYNIKWQGTGAQYNNIYIAFGTGGNNYLSISRGTDQWYNANVLRADLVSNGQVVASNNAMRSPNDVVVNDWLRYPYWYEIVRNGQQITLRYSYDGTNFSTAFSSLLTTPVAATQRVILDANVWTTADSYTDWDYIHVDAAAIPLKGDVNNDRVINLADAIAALRLSSGLATANVSIGADVNNDGQIGLAEALYVLQKLGGLRVEAGGAGTYTASGTYTWNSTTGVITWNWTSSSFICDGPSSGAGSETGVTITSTAMTWPDMTWSRTSGTAGDILGTWTSSNSTTGNSYTLTFNADGTVSLVGVIVRCTDGSGEDFSVWLGESRTMAVSGATTDKLVAHFHLKAPKNLATQVVVNGPAGWTQTFANRQPWFDDPNNYDGFYTSTGSMDVDISRAPLVGDVYTFTVSKTAGGTATYTQTIKQVLTAAPTVTSPASHSFAGRAGNRLDLAWTLPDPGIGIGNIRIESNFTGATGSVQGVVTSPTGGYIDIPANATPGYIDVRIHYRDEIFTNCRFEFGN